MTDRFDAATLYRDVYCARGEMESRIKEQQLDLFADRTSTALMQSNQLRLYFSTFAWVLISELRRLGLEGTSMARAQAGTIRNRLLTVGARIHVSVRIDRCNRNWSECSGDRRDWSDIKRVYFNSYPQREASIIVRVQPAC